MFDSLFFKPTLRGVLKNVRLSLSQAAVMDAARKQEYFLFLYKVSLATEHSLQI